MSAATGWLNTAWMLKCSFEGAAFARACRHVARTQAQVLADILRANRCTAFGAAHGFDRIHDPRAYQERVPLATYEDFAGAIRRIGAGEMNVLTWEPVQLLEPTSGTAGGEKLIPYTAGLRRQFQRGVAAWIADLFRHRPAVRRGRAYWSISPALGAQRRSPGGIPIGFADDAAYLGWWEQLALRQLLVMPGAVARLPDMSAFRYCTLRFLLAAADLSLISVWNPTFLSALLVALPQWHDRLCDDIHRGTLHPPVPLAPELAKSLSRSLKTDPERARFLASVGPASVRQFWPRLALISCWTDAAASRFVPELRRLFPDVEIQSKGLLATEGFVSVPLVGEPAAALAVCSHFFEFEELTSARCKLAHELERGGCYRVVLTTAGGLYRYQLRDEVEVVGFRHQCPLLRFQGKSDQVSDLVGEKLAEPQVRAVLDRLPALRILQPRFTLLVPVEALPARYRLYVQGPGIDDALPSLEQLRADLQAGLEENPYYRQAVALGQLAPVEVAVLDSAGAPGWLLFERRRLALGQRCGAIKPVALDRWTGWPQVFEPWTMAPASAHR
jgi:hypothetical protein